MKIEKRRNTPARKNPVREDIELACKIGPIADPVCCPDCEYYDPETSCGNACQYAPLRLSSEPALPIEKLITPLVFELKKLGIFYPCWSCEGHNDKMGKLAKHPSVWFYSESVVHVRALENTVCKLFFDGKLSTQWHIIVGFSDCENPDTTFTLTPVLSEKRATLFDLQKDVITLAQYLPGTFWEQCHRLMEYADSTNKM